MEKIAAISRFFNVIAINCMVVLGLEGTKQ